MLEGLETNGLLRHAAPETARGCRWIAVDGRSLQTRDDDPFGKTPVLT